MISVCLWAGFIQNRVPLLELLTVISLIYCVKSRSFSLAYLLKAPGLGWYIVFATAAVVCFVTTSVNLPYWRVELYILIHNSIIPVCIYVSVWTCVQSRGQLLRLKSTALLGVSGFAILTVFYVPDYGWSVIERVIYENRSSRFILPGAEGTIGATTLSLYLSIFVPIAVGHFIMAVKRYDRVVAAVAISVLLLSLYILGTRFAWVAVIVGLGLIYCIWLIHGGQQKLMLLSIALFTLVLFLFAFLFQSSLLNHDLHRRIESLISFEGALEDDSLSTRIFLWGQAWEFFKINPLGSGYFTFLNDVQILTKTSDGIKAANTHNELLLIGLGTGWIGLLGWSLGLCQQFQRFATAARAKVVEIHTEGTIGLGCMAVILIGFMFDTASNHADSLSAMPAVFFLLALSCKATFLEQPTKIKE